MGRAAWNKLDDDDDDDDDDLDNAVCSGITRH